jgi:RNA recognition motif-containing protein
MSSQFNKEQAKKSVDLILDQMRSEADPAVLNSYRKLFKKEISFFRRSWAAAWLLMAFDQGGKFRAPAPGRTGPGRNAEKNRSPGPGPGEDQMPRYPFSEEESKRLFVSIGRNRRVFPREILGLINTKTSIPREDIGAIRILDNYSFVQVRDTAAERIIEALNGQVFRGRILTVNYAKSRKDGDSGDGYEEESGGGGPSEIPGEEPLSEQDEDHSDEENI